MRVVTVVEDFRPGGAHIDEIAALAYEVLRGWPDQRPVTAALVRSCLRSWPGSSRASRPSITLVTCRDGGRLVAAGALRRSTGDVEGRLWGPLVHPAYQRRGLGRRLLGIMSNDIGFTLGSITTAGVPIARAGSFFGDAGWQPHRDLVLFTRRLPLVNAPAQPVQGLRLRSMQAGESLDQPLTDLSLRCKPQARGTESTFKRWISDERFSPGCLVIAELDTALVGAALVYPLAHTDAIEPTEAFLSDLLVDPTLRVDETAGISRCISRAAFANAFTAHDARIARSVVPVTDRNGRQVLIHCGLIAGGLLRTYRSAD